MKSPCAPARSSQGGMLTRRAYSELNNGHVVGRVIVDDQFVPRCGGGQSAIVGAVCRWSGFAALSLITLLAVRR